jgi:hypothetical protein
MATGMFSQHQPRAAQTDRFRAHNFVSVLIFQDAILVNARLVGKCISAHDGFVGLNRDASVVRNHAADTGDLGGINAGFQGIDRAPGMQRHYYLFQRGIASPFPDAVDGNFRLASPSLDSCQGIGGRQSQVVVTMHGDDGIFNPWCMSDNPGD